MKTKTIKYFLISILCAFIASNSSAKLYGGMRYSGGHTYGNHQNYKIAKGIGNSRKQYNKPAQNSRQIEYDPFPNFRNEEERQYYLALYKKRDKIVFTGAIVIISFPLLLLAVAYLGYLFDLIKDKKKKIDNKYRHYTNKYIVTNYER